MPKRGAPKGNTNSKKYKDKNVLKKKIDEYFSSCDEKGKYYTMTGLANALGLDRRTLLNYSKDELFFPLIKNAKSRVEEQLEECLYRLGNNSGVIFNLKNNYEWKDHQEEKKNNNDIEDLTTLADMLGFGKK